MGCAEKLIGISLSGSHSSMRVFRCAVCFSYTAILYCFLTGFTLQGKERITAFSFGIQQVWSNYCCYRRMCFYFDFFPHTDIGIHLIKQQDVSGR